MQDLMLVEVSGCTIATTPDAQEIASNHHTELTAITLVCDAATQTAATDKAVAAQRFLKDLETCRKTVKAPILELGRKIDDLAAELSAPVKEQVDRVSRLVANFQRAEMERVERERRAREEAERKAMDEARRKALEAEAAEQKITTEADLQSAVAKEQEAIAAEAAMYKTLTAPQPAREKAAGTVTKKVLRYEVTDIHALYKAAPHLVKLEPNVMAIKSTCNAGQTIPGLKLWEELDVNFRTR